MARRLAKHRQTAPSTSLTTTETLLKLNPTYHDPRHLHPIVDALEASWQSPRRITMHAPPQHGKTELVMAFALATLQRRPETRIAYVTYEAHRAWSKSYRARQQAVELGIELDQGQASKEEWRTTAGGGMLATGAGGPLTGVAVDLLLVDDPYKNRQQAESAAYRRTLRDWWQDVAMTRVQPEGSVFVWHTRWHPDDLIGWMHREHEGQFEHIALPAIDEAGQALWPERYPLKVLETKRRAVGEYTWASLYQGEPIPRGGAVFNEPTFYTDPPKIGRYSIGVDLAYTAKSHADYSVATVIQEERLPREPNRYYVREVIRRQCDAPSFLLVLKQLTSKYPGVTPIWHAAGTEKGAADFIKQQVRLKVLPATQDKFARSQKLAAAWNDGRVLLPEGAPWVDDYVAEVCSFTGTGGDPNDDMVDASASAFSAFSHGASQWVEAMRNVQNIG